MKFAVLGAGCVGSVISQQLYDYYDKNVSLVATGAIRKRLLSDGVVINGCRYDFSILNEDEAAPDLVFICVKNYDLENACNDLAPFISKQTLVLPLLNGISSTSFLQERFPENHVLYGYISKTDTYFDGHSYRYNIAGDLHFGNANNATVSDQIVEIKSILNRTDINAIVDNDMIRGIWKKWMLNIGANQVSTLTEADYLQFSEISEIHSVLRSAMQELLEIAGYEGVNLNKQDIEDILRYLTTYPYPKKTSMLQDILACRKTEIESISGDILMLSKKWNCPCPVNQTMYYLIKSKERVFINNKLDS